MERDAKVPRWLFEFASWRRLPWSFVATLVVAASAGRLFRSLRIENPLRPIRLCLLAILSIATVYVLLAVPVVLQIRRDLRALDASLALVVTPFSLQQYTAGGVRLPGNMVLDLERVGWREEVAVVGWSVLMPFAGRTTLLSRDATVLNATQPPTLVLRSSRGLLPTPWLVRRPAGWGDDLLKYPLLVGATTSPRERWAALGPLLRHTVTLVAAVAGSVAAFTVLPFARTRAKVRWRQIGRCAVYLLASVPVWSLLLRVVGFGTAGLYDGWHRGWTELLPIHRPILGTAILLWLTLWWYAAVGRYLRMERPFAVALSVASIGLLSACTFIVALGSW
jgi:hypothetical protein